MFALNIPSTFGDTIYCRINGKPKRVTWRDEHTLVIETDPYATAPVDTDCQHPLLRVSNAVSNGAETCFQ